MPTAELGARNKFRNDLSTRRRDVFLYFADVLLDTRGLDPFIVTYFKSTTSITGYYHYVRIKNIQAALDDI